MAFDQDIQGCAELVQRGAPDRFRAVMAAPPAARAVLFAVHAFNLEVARAPWVTQESMIAEMRLQWWRDALDEMRRGGPVRRHEVATPLSRMLDPGGAARLDALVEARRWDIYREPFEDIAHFRDYIGKTSGNLVVTAALGLGDGPEDPLQRAGYALGLASWLRAVPALEKAGRIPLVDGTHDGVRALAREGLEALREARRAGVP
uniref:squalene/phytoene synthase family protein n=1 Tax=Roseovarius halophilus (ex Wu et al. 2025) TaxID=3376060 RepID=UPI00399A762E